MREIPSFYIEGYYGKWLTPTQRIELIEKAQKAGITGYFYAPKEDPYHRRYWQKPYPAIYLNHLKECGKKAKQIHFQWIPCISPFLNFDYSKKSFRLLIKKIESLLSTHATGLGLFFDDIPLDICSIPLPLQGKQTENISPSSPWIGQKMAQLQLEILAQLLMKIPALAETAIYFCPTVYCDSLAKGELGSAYLTTILQKIPAPIKLLWTGKEVISTHISTNSLQIFGDFPLSRIVWWDNRYANDYSPDRIFCGPLTLPPQEWKKGIGGWGFNLTGSIHHDIFLVELIGYTLGNYTSKQAWEKVLAKHQVPNQIRHFGPLLMQNFGDLPMSGIRKKLKILQASIDYLVFEWQGPLHDSWFAALQGIRRDLALLAEIENGIVFSARSLKMSPLIQYLLDKPINSLGQYTSVLKKDGANSINKKRQLSSTKIKKNSKHTNI